MIGKWRAAIKAFGRVYRITRHISPKSTKDDLHLGDLARLVVASENSDSVLEADFEGDKQGNSLDTVVAAIDVIAHEKVVGVGWLATDLEKLAEIMELAVDVTANSDRRANLLHVRLVYQDFLGLK